MEGSDEMSSNTREGQEDGAVPSTYSSFFRSEGLVFALLEDMLDPFYLVDCQGMILEHNYSASEALGYHRGQVLRGSYAELTQAFQPTQWMALWAQVLPGKKLVLEAEHMRRDGSVFPVEIRLTKLAGVEPEVMLLICQDISDKKRKERQWRRVHEELRLARDEAMEASATKSRFLANMSHELRTPLNAIIGYSEMVEEELEDIGEDCLIEDMKKIQDASHHLLALINDLLDLSKIEADKLELVEEFFSPKEVVDELASLLVPLLEKQQNNLVVEIEPDIGLLYTDRRHVRQVLLNLVSNSNKFTERGTIWIRGWRYEALGQWWLALSVRDTGIGISQEKLATLFTPFVQADRSIAKNFGGTGLGLALSQKLCEVMGGEITARSEPGVGSTFTMRLPLTSQNATESRELRLATDISPQHTPMPQLSMTSGGHIRSVLCIARHRPFQQTMQAHLSAHDIVPRVATSLREAVAFANAFQPEVAILSKSLPESEELIRVFRSSERLNRMPLLLFRTEEELAETLTEVLRLSTLASY
jgi:PAS domain S-box-containing protein